MRFTMVIAPRRHYRIEGNAVVAVRRSPNFGNRKPNFGNRKNVSEWIVPLVDVAQTASN